MEQDKRPRRENSQGSNMTTEITINISVSIDKIHNAIIGAFEGGSCYWVHDATLRKGYQRPDDDLVWWGREEVFSQDFEFEARFDDPYKPEGNGAGRKFITNADIPRALELMATRSPKAFSDLMTEDDDATTHDVFMQYLLLGDIIYD